MNSDHRKQNFARILEESELVPGDGMKSDHPKQKLCFFHKTKMGCACTKIVRPKLWPSSGVCRISDKEVYVEFAPEENLQELGEGVGLIPGDGMKRTSQSEQLGRGPSWSQEVG